jgi:cell pole-organizing protein PopZ
MEEILASIRRIIADDSANPPAGASTTPKPDAVPQSDLEAPNADILELTEQVDAGPGFATVRGPDVMFREEQRPQPAPPPVEAAAPLPAPVSPPKRPSAARDSDLMSPTSTAAVAAAFNSLATTVLTENSRTLEDLVKEMMRPMLKQWLEENLPGLVERMVRAEIERVSRGGR